MQDLDKLQTNKENNINIQSGNETRMRHPKFWGFSFSPMSLAAEQSGGMICDPIEDLKSDFEYLCDLLGLIKLEKLKVLWSEIHREWIFYTLSPKNSLGKGSKSQWNMVFKEFKKKAKFYEEIKRHEEVSEQK
jgi:hypothetical protein